MVTPGDLLENLRTINVINDAIEAAAGTKDEMARLNVEQLASGRDSEGSKLSPKYRNKSYAAKKNRINPAPGMWNPDLILTGAFTGSLNVSVSGQNINFSSGDSKKAGLVKKYGDNIFGLNDKQQDYYNYEVFLPEFRDIITSKTGLEFD